MMAHAAATKAAHVTSKTMQPVAGAGDGDDDEPPERGVAGDDRPEGEARR